RQARRPAVRLLHAGLRRRDARRPAEEPQRQPQGNRGRAGRQHLPLRHLPADARRHRRPVRQGRRQEEGGLTMANSWPKERRLIGKKHSRLDGPDKATGRAKYSYDMNPKGLLHAVMLRSPHAHAKITKLDYAEAEKMPGVKAVFVIAEEGKELF